MRDKPRATKLEKNMDTFKKITERYLALLEGQTDLPPDQLVEYFIAECHYDGHIEAEDILQGRAIDLVHDVSGILANYSLSKRTFRNNWLPRHYGRKTEIYAMEKEQKVMREKHFENMEHPELQTPQQFYSYWILRLENRFQKSVITEPQRSQLQREAREYQIKQLDRTVKIPAKINK